MKLQGSCHCQAVRFEVESFTPYPFMRCYCSICRKTAGGGGYAINIMGQAETLKIKGKSFVKVYRVKMQDKAGKSILSSGHRHFCKRCASYLWVSDPNWPELVHPFASAIDTALPKPPDSVHLMLNYVASWVDVPHHKHDHYYAEYPRETIASWHKRRKLFKK